MEVARPELERLVLTYHLAGDVSAIELQSACEPDRADRLWRHTCFEAFLKTGAAPGYLELNAAPSSEWASYWFTGHRAGMSIAEEVVPDRFETNLTNSNSLRLRAKLTIRGVRFERQARESSRFSYKVNWLIPGLATARLNLTAVIKDTSGRRSYWALAHPDGEPDFHHPDCFVLDLPPPA